MAYSAQTDYKALQDSLKKQMETATDEATRANLQAQIDAADQSRIEKIASNLNTYGKYASGSELDSAAGIMATNQIGTGYETQKANLNRSYDQAKQNASNNALSRGMARSSFVQDRMANLDSDRANALSGVDAAKALAIQNAKANILSNYQDRQASNLATDKKDFGNNIMAYYNDFQQEINNVRDDGDPTNDWKIEKLMAARNEKILAQQKAAAKAYSGSGGGGGGGGDGGDGGGGGDGEGGGDIYNTAPQLTDAQVDLQVGMNRTPTGQLATIKRMLNAGQITEDKANALIQKFNLSA